MVLEKIGRRLHLQPNHPLCIMKRRVEDYCARYAAEKGQTPFVLYDDLSPIVSAKSCFDDLLIPPEHVSRQKSDTYYITDSTVSHMTAISGTMYD
jgi:phenylalanyl-tRNA synthetase alpha chain